MWGQERGGVSGRGGWQVLWGWCSVVYLELDNAAAAARAGFGGQRYEKAEFQAKVGCLCHIALLFKTFFQSAPQTLGICMTSSLKVLYRPCLFKTFKRLVMHIPSVLRAL